MLTRCMDQSEAPAGATPFCPAACGGRSPAGGQNSLDVAATESQSHWLGHIHHPHPSVLLVFCVPSRLLACLCFTGPTTKTVVIQPTFCPKDLLFPFLVELEDPKRTKPKETQIKVHHHQGSDRSKHSCSQKTHPSFSL